MRPLLFILGTLIPLGSAAYSHQLNCRPEISNAYRYTAVNNMNIYRQFLANGTAPNKCGTLPGAKNMYKIWYDCHLEDMAWQWASTCTTSWPGNAIAYTGMSTAAFPDAGAVDQLLNTFKSDLSQIVTNGITADVKYTSTSIKGWNNYVAGQKTRVGCAYYYGCPSTNPSFPFTYRLACIFDAPSAALNNPAYEVGDRCSADSDCTTHMGSTCDVATGMCQYQYVDSGANTMCPGSTALLTDAQRMLQLDWHNKLRSQLAKGLEPDGAGGNAPPAKRMTKMKYDCAVEINANTWAQGCTWAHSSGASRPGMGENLYMTSDLNQDTAAAMTGSAQAWWAELKDFGVGPENNLTSEVFARGVGHYTQMAWQETTAIGCGIARCPTMTYVVCQYKPAGNYMNQLIYEIGPACQTNADCGGGGRTCSVSEGLCIVP